MRTTSESTIESRKPLPAPVVHRQVFRNNFLGDVRIEHGPRDLLSRLFLRGDTLLRERGINLSFAPIDGLLEVNSQNRDSWKNLFPVFNPNFGLMTPDNSFVLLGREPSGRVVAAQGARFFDLGTSTLKDECESLRLFYRDPETQMQPGESCIVTAESAARFTGPIIFSGAVWYHPDYRRQGLTSILPRITKAYSLTRWGSDVTFSFMAEDVVAGGTAPRAGYYHVEWDVLLKKTVYGDARMALIWSSADELVDYFSGLLRPRQAKVDVPVHQRAANDHTLAGGSH